MKVNVYILKKIGGTVFDTTGRMSKIHDSTEANIYVQDGAIYDPSPELIADNDFPADATARMSRIINHELYHAARWWSLLAFTDKRVARTFLETGIVLAALFGVFIFLNTLLGLVFAFFACIYVILRCASDLLRLFEEKRAQGCEADEIREDLFDAAERVRPWIFARGRFKRAPAESCFKPSRLKIMAKKRSRKKTAEYIGPMYTSIYIEGGKGLYGKKDQLDQTEWIYDVIKGEVVKNTYFGTKNRHPDYELKYGCQA